MINQSVYGFGGAFAVSGQYGSGYWGCRPSDSYGIQLSALFGNPYSGGCGSAGGGYHGYGMSGCFGQGWPSALGNSCHSYLNCMPNYGGQAFGCCPPSFGYGGCCGFPQPCQPCPCPPPCQPSCTEQTHKMWDVWFDTKVGQETTQMTPIILDLNGDGKAGITGKNILGDGTLDGPTVMFDMDPNNTSYEFKTAHWRPGMGTPAAEGGYWVDAENKKTDKSPPGGIQKNYAGWRYMDANGKLVGEMKDDGFYHYGKQEKREQTEWLAKDGGDGFLVSDYNKDGRINDATELFGTEGPNGQKFKNGYEKLAALHDTNKDGKISGKELEGLKIWKDSNADGVVQEGEFLSLASQGITSFDVRNYNGETMEGSYKTTTAKATTGSRPRPLPYMSFGMAGAGFGGAFAGVGFGGAFAGTSFGGTYAGFGFGGAYASAGFGGFSPYFSSPLSSFGFSAPWMGGYG